MFTGAHRNDHAWSEHRGDGDEHNQRDSSGVRWFGAFAPKLKPGTGLTRKYNTPDDVQMLVGGRNCASIYWY